MACTTNPRSIKVSTTGPCGTPRSPPPPCPLLRTSTAASRKGQPGPCRHAGNSRSPTMRPFCIDKTRPDVAPSPSRCLQTTQSSPLGHGNSPHECTSLPRCLPSSTDAQGATSYWASVVANPLRHMSHHGAQGTRWTAGCPRRVARPDSVRPPPTRRLTGYRVDGPNGIDVPKCGLSEPARRGAARHEY